MITKQLPSSMKRNADQKTVKVKDVGCVDQGKSKYKCIANIDGLKGVGQKSMDLSIKASCDAENCIWETEEDIR